MSQEPMRDPEKTMRQVDRNDMTAHMGPDFLKAAQVPDRFPAIIAETQRRQFFSHETF